MFFCKVLHAEMDKNLLKFITCCIIIIGTDGKIPQKIIGGSRARIQDAPHAVSIRYMNVHLCTGSIISENNKQNNFSHYILTTASCILQDINVVCANLKIFSGSNDLDNIFWSDEFVHEASFVIIHHNYSPRRFWENDIALIRLTEPIFFSSTRSPLPIISKRIPSPMDVTTWSWGQLIAHDTDFSSRYLQKLSIRTQTQSICQILFQLILDPYDWHLDTRNCATMPTPFTAIGNGDGSAALVARKHIIGIVSVISVKITGTPVIYTSVVHYRSWINDIIQKCS